MFFALIHKGIYEPLLLAVNVLLFYLHFTSIIIFKKFTLLRLSKPIVNSFDTEAE